MAKVEVVLSVEAGEGEGMSGRLALRRDFDSLEAAETGLLKWLSAAHMMVDDVEGGRADRALEAARAVGDGDTSAAEALGRLLYPQGLGGVHVSCPATGHEGDCHREDCVGSDCMDLKEAAEASAKGASDAPARNGHAVKRKPCEPAMTVMEAVTAVLPRMADMETFTVNDMFPLIQTVRRPTHQSSLYVPINALVKEGRLRVVSPNCWRVVKPGDKPVSLAVLLDRVDVNMAIRIGCASKTFRDQNRFVVLQYDNGSVLARNADMVIPPSAVELIRLRRDKAGWWALATGYPPDCAQRVNPDYLVAPEEVKGDDDDM